MNFRPSRPSSPGSRPARTWALHALGAAAACGVAVAFYHGLYAPWQHDVVESHRRIEQLQALLATGERVAAEHASLSDRLTALRRRAAATRARVPTTVTPDEFMKHLNAAATREGLAVEQCTAGLPEFRPDHARVEVTCRLVGSYASMCRCLARVDQFPQISQVTRLELTGGADPLAYPAQITFQLYYGSQSHDKEVKRGT